MSPLMAAILGGTILLVVWVTIEYFLTPILARRAIRRLIQNKDKIDPRARENPKHGSIVCDLECLTIRDRKGDSWKLPWTEVEEVHAFKRDLITVDLICLAFKKAGQEEYYEVHEEVAGYHNLLELLPNRLPGFTMNWIFDVAVPAFATNHQIIWKRATEEDL